MSANYRTSLPRWPWLLLFLVITAMLAVGAWVLYQYDEEAIHKNANEELTTVARLKAQGIVQWRNEVLRDAQGLALSPFFRKNLEYWWDHSNDPELTKDFDERLRVLAEEEDHDSATITDLNGNIKLHFNRHLQKLDQEERDLVLQVQKTRDVVMGDFFRDADGHLRMVCGIPVYNQEEQPFAVLLLGIDPQVSLYPALQVWPIHSETSEAILVRKDGHDVLFLNDLKFRPHSALELRIPLSQSSLPAVQAFEGYQGIVRGKDYRGVDVLAYIQRISDSPWIMIAKIDIDEIYHEAFYRRRVIALVTVILVLVAGLGVSLLFHFRQKRLYQDLYLAELATWEVEKEFRTTLYSIGDAVITAGADGHVRQMNPVAEALTGWTESEAWGHPLPEVFRIVNEATGNPVESPLDKILREGKVVGLANHTILVSRDGRQTAIADSGAPISGPEGGLTGVVLVFRDESIKREAERALRDAHRFNQQILSNTRDGLCVCDTSGVVTWNNRVWCQMTGHDGAVSPGKTYREVLAGIPHFDLEAFFEQALQGTPASTSDFPFPFGNEGKEGWAYLQFDPFTGEQGEITGVVATLNDITLRKATEERLRIDEELFQCLYDISQAPFSDKSAFLDFDLDEALRLTRSKIGYIYHYDEATQIFTLHAWSKGVMEECTIAEKQRVYELEKTGIWGEAVRQRKPILVNDFQAANSLKKGYPEGHVCLEKYLTVPIFQGSAIVGVIGVGNKEAAYDETDIRQLTLLGDAIWKMLERKRAAEALVESRHFYQQVIDSTQDGIVVLDTEGVVRLWNPAMEKLSGKSAAEMVGNRVFKVLSSLVETEDFHHWQRAVEGKSFTSPDHQYSLPETNRSGWVSSDFLPIYNEEGGSAGVIVCSHDISGRKNLETQLLQAQKMEAVGRLAGGVAHDFNNILTIILSYTGFAIEDAPDNSALAEDLTEVRKAAERAANLTRQLLAFSRKQVLQMQILNINEVVTNLEKMLRRLIGEDIALISRLAPELWSSKLDPGQLEQIIMNLAVNARDAMPTGGELTLITANMVLGPEYVAAHPEVEPGEYIALTIADTGMGMNEATREKIFDPFFTTKEAGKGTGLGLSTVYGIVKQSGGSIFVYSEPGHGTTFKLYFPRCEETFEEQPPVSAPLQISGQETILLVEDEDSIRELGERILSAEGYKILVAQDGNQALWKSQNFEDLIHLLVTDVVMPGINGRELARHLTEARPGMKVLYISGYTDNILSEQGLPGPEVDLLHKPFNAQTLLKKVKKVLERG